MIAAINRSPGNIKKGGAMNIGNPYLVKPNTKLHKKLLIYGGSTTTNFNTGARNSSSKLGRLDSGRDYGNMGKRAAVTIESMQGSSSIQNPEPSTTIEESVSRTTKFPPTNKQP